MPYLQMWVLDNTVWNSWWIKWEITKKIREYFKRNENGNSLPKLMRYSESHAYFQGKKKSNYVTFNCKKLERRSKQKTQICNNQDNHKNENRNTWKRIKTEQKTKPVMAIWIQQHLDRLTKTKGDSTTIKSETKGHYCWVYRNKYQMCTMIQRLKYDWIHHCLWWLVLRSACQSLDSPRESVTLRGRSCRSVWLVVISVGDHLYYIN